MENTKYKIKFRTTIKISNKKRKHSDLKKEIGNGIVIHWTTSLHLRHHKRKINSALHQPDKSLVKTNYKYQTRSCNKRKLYKYYRSIICFYTDPSIPEDLTGEWFAKGTDNQVYTQPVSRSNTIFL